MAYDYLTSEEENRLRSLCSDFLKRLNAITNDKPVTVHISPSDSYVSFEHESVGSGRVVKLPRMSQRVLFEISNQ